MTHFFSFRFTSAGFYHTVASRIGHGAGLLVLITAMILIALRCYLVVVLVATVGSYLSMSDALFVLVELYIIYTLIMLKVVTAKLPPGYNQIQPNIAKYRGK